MFDQSSTTVGPEMSNRGETIQTAKAIRTNVVIASVAQSGMSRNPRRGRSGRGEVSGRRGDGFGGGGQRWQRLTGRPRNSNPW